MEKPKDYYLSNKTPYSQWKQEWKDYKNYKRRLVRNPETADFTPEQRAENKKRIAKQNIQKSHEKYNNLPQEEKDEWNQKKNNYSKLSEEEKKIKIQKLNEGNKNWWNSLSEKERKEFSKLRYNQKDEETNKRVINNLINLNKERCASLSQEEIQTQVKIMQNGYWNKYYNDQSFRESQISKLRINHQKWRDSLSTKEKLDLLHNNKLNDKFEKLFNESRLVNDFYYDKEYEVRYDLYNFKFWDYVIYSSENNIVAVVDLDGAYYHGDGIDYDGLHSKEERDEKRSLFIPNGNVKAFIITENNFNLLFNEMMECLYMKYDEYLQNIFNKYRKIKFPFPYYHHIELINSLKFLFNMDCNDKYHKDISLNTRIGDIIIYHFHHSIYFIEKNGKLSPYKAWNCDHLLMECIRNKYLFRSVLNHNKILQGFNICKIATKVSVFSAARAKMIINKYLSDYDTIFDPFSGFSGRMLGTISLGKKYIGQDISYTHVKESNDIIHFIKQCKNLFPNIVIPELYKKDSLNSYGTYDCLFTCPPYSDKEQWKDVPVSMNTCDDWIDICLNHFKCKTYLFVVDSTEKYKDYIVDTITNKGYYKIKNYIVKI